MAESAKAEVLAGELVIFRQSILSSQDLIAQAEYLNAWRENLSFYNTDGIVERYESTIHNLSSATLEEIFFNIENYVKILEYKFHTFDKDSQHYMLHISKYTEGGSIGLHTDVKPSEDSGDYTAVIYMNDDYDGGELGFPELGIEIKPKSGDMLIFPIWYPHYANRSTNGVKYISIFNVGIFK